MHLLQEHYLPVGAAILRCDASRGLSKMTKDCHLCLRWLPLPGSHAHARAMIQWSINVAMDTSYLTIAMYIIITREGPNMELPLKDIPHLMSHTESKRPEHGASSLWTNTIERFPSYDRVHDIWERTHWSQKDKHLGEATCCAPISHPGGLWTTRIL